MKPPLSAYLEHVLHECREDGGANADYIPELKAANPNHLGVALATIDGDVYTAGDCEVEFAIESISKAFVYALALEDLGFDGVAKKIGVEPSGDPFNQLSLDPETGRPDNPLINAGAITTHSLVKGDSPQARCERIHDMLSRCAGRKLRVMEGVYQSEMKTADRNRALAYMLHMTGIIESDPMAAVEWYTRQCSIAVTARDLAIMVATLANRGVQPITRERIFGPDVVVRVLSVMLTCGMYDWAGDWVTNVGIPSKSGVGGGIIGALPGQMGVASFSPQLDSHGNSFRGIKIFQHLSDYMGISLMRATPAAHSVIRTDRTIPLPKGKGKGVSRPDKLRIVAVHGGVNFVAAEHVVRRLCTIEKGDSVGIALDLRSVTSMHEIAVRLLVDTVEGLMADGHPVAVIDPDGHLPKNKMDGAERHETLINLVPEELRAGDNQIVD